MENDHKSLRELLEFEEGRRNKIYSDTKGIPTGGVGHAFHVGSVLPDEVVDLLLAHDMETAWRQFELLNLNHLSQRRQWVCVAMIFQMGFAEFRRFTRTRRYLRREEYRLAALEMIDSVWAREDSPERAVRMAQIMLEG